MIKHPLWLFLPFFLLLTQCKPLEEEKLSKVDWSFSDTGVRKIYSFQDQQNLDSLLAYFNHPNPTYRYGAALAFSSFKNSAAIDSLIPLLRDEVLEVRGAAAYALGQIGDGRAEPHLVAAFENNDTLSLADYFNSIILEAVGKCGGEKQLQNLATISTYLRADTLLLEGQARGIYHYALRGMTVPDGTARMVDFVVRRGYPQSVRLMAVHYLSRAKNIVLDSLPIASLTKTLAQDADPNIRMALAVALGKTKSPVAFNALENRFGLEKDYRVKCQIIRALTNFDYTQVRPLLTPVINDENVHVATTAAQYFVMQGKPFDASLYWRKARLDTALHWQTQIMLYKAAIRHYSNRQEDLTLKGQIIEEVKNLLNRSDNPYQKAAALDALSQYKWNYRYINDNNYDEEGYVVRTASMNALAQIVQSPDFVAFFGVNGSKRVMKEFADIFEAAIVNKDPAMVAIAAGVLRDPKLGFVDYLDSLDFLTTTLEKLSLPSELEAYIELKKTIDYFQGNDNGTLPDSAYKHRDIDWEIYDDISGNTKAELDTPKGKIVLEFLFDKAPGTLINFIQLARSNFYNGKNFHRVVSNFVIQGGCPRGDGYGALDYTIRSELPPVYYDKAGLVGMASAGNHTECTQFFIAHSPAPHLDGNYTIFARVIEGMDVVHQIEQGDVIENIRIL